MYTVTSSFFQLYDWGYLPQRQGNGLKRYRCESDIPLYKWKVTWNYAYSPFKFHWLDKISWIWRLHESSSWKYQIEKRRERNFLKVTTRVTVKLAHSKNWNMMLKCQDLIQGCKCTCVSPKIPLLIKPFLPVSSVFTRSANFLSGKLIIFKYIFG